MRLGAFFSLAAHAGAVAAGLLSIQEQAPPTESSEMIIIPLELMTIGDITDIAPVTAQAKLDEEAAEQEEAETIAAASAPPKVEEDSVALEAALTPPKKDDKKPDPKPKKEEPEDLSSYIDSLALTGAKPTPPKNQKNAKADAANADDAKPRMGAGEMRRMTVTVQDYIRAQLVNKRCWTDHSDMADAQRLTTTFRVRFGANGKFIGEPELRDRQPSGDPPMQVFVEHARTALNKCNTLGWQVPKEYFDLKPAPYWIDITFLPKVAAMQ